MELTRKQAFELNAVLKNAKFDYPISNRSRYMSSFNIKATDAEITATNEAFPVPEEWNKLVDRGMAMDFSWTASAKKYQKLYEEMLQN